MPKNEELSKLINESRFTLVTSSSYQILLKKYMEVPMSGSTMIGDIPPDYPELNGKMIEVKNNATHDEIIKVIKRLESDNAIKILENLDKDIKIKVLDKLPPKDKFLL